jgi:hypothetical protein
VAGEGVAALANAIETAHFAAAYDVRKPINHTFNPFTHDLSLAPKPTPPERKLKQGSSRTVFSTRAEPNAWEL